METGYLCQQYLRRERELDAFYLTVSFVFCCLNPRDYTILNRRKDVMGKNQELLSHELDVITILQSDRISYNSLHRSISKGSRAVGPSKVCPEVTSEYVLSSSQGNQTLLHDVRQVSSQLLLLDDAPDAATLVYD